MSGNYPRSKAGKYLSCRFVKSLRPIYMKEFLKKALSRKYRDKLAKVYHGVIGPCYQLLDLLLLPITIPVLIFLKASRRRRFKNLPLTQQLCFSIGVFPIEDHYYEPLFNPKHLKRSLRLDRNLPGIDLNVEEQLQLLSRFHFNDELLSFPMNKKDDKVEYCYNHGPFNAGDSEYLYNMIRLFKPAKIVEIGSGSSTLMAMNAIRKNKAEDISYQCEHICIEPYEHAWLKQCEVTVIRKLVEEVDPEVFRNLGKNDILFIDSSHIIRPQGDVLFEYLELLPILNPGVLVHIHDIFTPKDYPDGWVHAAVLWNEQYLLEAFLSGNKDFKIIGATNFLMHHHYDAFAGKCPVLKLQGDKQPGSFWLRRS
jgi:predicted O-methyltransferase YrrM